MKLNTGAPGVVAHKDFIIIGNNVMSMDDANVFATKLIESIDQARAYREVHKPLRPRDVTCPHCGHQWQTRVIPGGHGRCSQCEKSFLAPFLEEEDASTR